MFNRKINFKDEIKSLFIVNKSDRPWHMPLGAGIAMAGPLFVGACFDSMKLGSIASMAGILFLYTLKTPLHHRMAYLMACGFGLIVSFVLGGLTHLNPSLTPLALGLLTMIVTMTVRYYQIDVPGNFFFLMTATIVAFMPFEPSRLIELTGYFVLGAIWAWLVAFVYSLTTIKFIKPERIQRVKYRGFDIVIVDSVIIGFFVGISVLLAQIIGFDRPYWVPISTLAILQGMTLRSTWTRQIHRISGTAVGIFLAYFLLRLDLNYYQIAALVGLLGFLIELTVVRNYGVAAIFITPMTIYMADMGGVIDGSSVELILARLVDIAFGSFIGFIGGICLHSIKFREVIKKFISIFYK
ncbi:MAG: FUSC family protein [Campylobacteraceae bacterium]|nr:FUSC family protein [Campylobacteraceae bacterium]